MKREHKVKCAVCDERKPIQEMVRWGLKWVCGIACIESARVEAARTARETAVRSVARHERSLVRKEKRAASRKNGINTNVRRRVKRRDRWRCRWCGEKEGLEVHHILYRSQGGPDWDVNLITLCHLCHKRGHNNKKTWQPVLLALIWIHYVERRRMTVPEVYKRVKREGLV